MTQVSKYPISKAVSERIMDIFIKTLINVKDDKEADRLISDFLTPTERVVLSKRLTIALLLEKGYNYKTIGDILKVSSATIAHVNNSRLHGSNGYRKFIGKIISDDEINNFIIDTLTNVLKIPATMSRGTSVWKEIHKKAKAKQSKKTAF